MSEQEKKWSDKNWDERTPLEHFDGFLERFVKGESYIKKDGTDANNLRFEKQQIKDVYISFRDKSKDKNKDKKFDEVVKDLNNVDLEILNHAIFLWALPNTRKTQFVGSEEYNSIPNCSVGGGGSGYVQTKVKGIRFILYIFTQIFKEEDIDNIKNLIKTICLGSNTKDNDFPYGKDKEPFPDGVKNFLLHLCDKDNYEPIASSSDKKKIVKTFINKVNDKKKEIKEHIDECIKAIKNKIISAQNQDVDANANEESKSNEISITFNETKIEILKSLLPDDEKKLGKFSFYNDKINWLWRGESDGDNLSRVQLLEYKKAMVLYGPPGTGKTYTAMELAKQILVRNIKKDIDSNDFNALCKSNIKDLQLHVNYSYENFIAGQVIKDNNIVTKKGFIYDVIDKANENSELPFVVILDEMNRVDVSRVFGELFTAIEKRNKPVDLTLPDPQNPGKRLTLTIPENIYFIGTMNEIDFSLEQLDFALRRRFIWELADYNSDSLEQIITSRLGEDLLKNNIGNISNFIECCDNLNKTIEGHNSLGKEYHIGHAFFAEIAEIIKKHPTKDFMKSKKILWQISILPTLEAYCGTMDSSDKKTFIEKCKTSYEGKGE